MKNKIFFVSVLLILTAAVGCGTEEGNTPEEEGSQVSVTANLPLSGNLATYGEAIQEGARIALDSLEGQGPTLEFTWQDNASKPREAVSIMQQQLMNSPDLYVSGVRPQTMAIKDQITERNIPHFVWIFDATINSGDTKNSLRTWVSYKLEPQVYMDYAKKKDPERIAVVHLQNAHAIEAYAQTLVPDLKKMEGVNEVLPISFDPSKRDFKSIATQLDNFSPDLIILNGFQSNLVALVRALRPFGLIQDGNTIATYDMLDASNVLGPDELEGIRVVAPRFVTRPDRGRIAKWRKAFRKEFGEEPLYTHAFAYDMALIMNDAAKRLDLPASNKEWIEALRNTDMEGVTGPLRIDEDGSLITPLEVGVWRDGKLKPGAISTTFADSTFATLTK
jgi:branched-chain amino acid transport system substrate-binding protein